MKASPTIAHKLAQHKHVISAEFYPPRSEDAARQILQTAEALQPHGLDFVSITYGAGGSTRERTIEYGEILQNQFAFDVMPHLTCVGHSKNELLEILKRYQVSGFKNIMALRGDPPKGETLFKPHPEGLAYGSELVSFIKAHYPDFCLGVGGYPQKHPEALSMEEDLKHLKHKVDQGADFITTQLFFNNEDYFSFVHKCRQLGITCPIIPGIMLATSYEKTKRFCSFCEATIPDTLAEGFLELDPKDEHAALAWGVEWAFRQIRGLLQQNAPGVHLYLLNCSEPTLMLLDKMQRAGLID